jgi:hypothetical protein
LNHEYNFEEEMVKNDGFTHFKYHGKQRYFMAGPSDMNKQEYAW